MPTDSTQFLPLETADRLHDGYRKSFEVAGLDLLLLQHDGRVHLVESLCPHAAYPMLEGKIFGNELRCPMHGYLFDLDSGACTLSSEGPCRAIHVYPVVFQNGQVGLHLPVADGLNGR